MQTIVYFISMMAGFHYQRTSVCPSDFLSVILLCVTLWTVNHQAPYPWDSPGKSIGVGCCAFFQGIFLTLRSNPCLLCLLHWQAGSSPLTPHGKSFNHPTGSYYYISLNVFITSKFCCL